MIQIAVSLLPVFIFLVALILLDSFKLLRMRSVVLTILIGCAVALLAYVFNTAILRRTSIDRIVFSRYLAPVLEEVLKAGYIVYLLRVRKVGFMVDSAIHGFAIGAGFAFVENVYYLSALQEPSLIVWIIRGLGTAVMHGGATAIFGIVASKLSDRHSSVNITRAALALLLALAIHSLYNHFFLPPILSTAMLLVILPATIIVVFEKSEKSTRDWLGLGLDTDLELLDMILTGNISETKIGRYFQSLQIHMPGSVIADMVCLLRIHVELSIRAKGVLLMRKGGYNIPPGPEIKEKFAELEYLQKTIGKTGLLALSPLQHRSSRDLWQIYMLGQS